MGNVIEKIKMQERWASEMAQPVKRTSCSCGGHSLTPIARIRCLQLPVSPAAGRSEASGLRGLLLSGVHAASVVAAALLLCREQGSAHRGSM